MSSASTVFGSETLGRGNRISSWTGILGSVLFLVATFAVLSNIPDIRQAGAVQELVDFYNDDGKRNVLLVGEFGALAGSVLLLWFVPRLFEVLRSEDGTHGRRAVAATIGMASFTVLAMLSLFVQTSVAATASFSKAFEPDPHTAMVLAHLSYVIMAGAMMAAAVALVAASGIIRTGATPIPARLGTLGLVVAGLSVVSFVFVYGGLLLVLIWTGATAAYSGRA